MAGLKEGIYKENKTTPKQETTILSTPLSRQQLINHNLTN